MAEQTFTLQLNAYTSRKLAERAEAAGIAPERLAEMVIESALFERDDFEWANGAPADPLPPRDVQEPTYAWEDVKAEVRARLDSARRRRA